MAIAEIISGSVPGGTSFGKFYNHQMLSAGSLLLFDPQHSLGEFSGLPADNSSVPNVAADIAAGLTGASEADMAFILENDEASGVASIKERSGLGGLCGIYASDDENANTGWSRLGLSAPLAVRNYIAANTDHAFYISLWINMLRGGDIGPSGSAPQPAAFVAQNTNDILFLLHGNANAARHELGERVPGTYFNDAFWDNSEGTPVLTNAASAVWAGTTPTGAAMNGPIFMTGDYGAWQNYNSPGHSGIIERAYFEDLTVSGRTYAEVDALDLAMHTAAHAEGGSWYGDTFTDPDTLP